MLQLLDHSTDKPTISMSTLFDLWHGTCCDECTEGTKLVSHKQLRAQLKAA